MICHFPNINYFKSFIVLKEVICLFLGSGALLRDFVMFVVGFSFRGFWKGNYYCSLMALSWDPVMIFT